MFKKIWRTIVQVDLALDRQYPFFVLLVLALALRVPNLSEPYWYGDEGIYLTIGQSLNKGAVLYKEIIDHKTPIIYFLAQTHTQLNFRLLTISWMLVTTGFFYYFAKKLTKSSFTAFISGLIFVLGTTLPALEGNIPNGELFVMGFVMVGGYLLLTSWYGTWFNTGKAPQKMSWQLVAFGGVFLSLAVLTKVPAIFDAAAFIAFGYFAVLQSLGTFTTKQLVTLVKEKSEPLMRGWGILSLGLVIPVVVSILYFVSLGAGKAYLDFGLLYNFRYASNWQLPFSNPVLLFLFTLQGKVLLLFFLIAFLTFAKKWISPAFQFVLLWCGLSLVASSLSNRPYPHYFLQIVPPFSLLVGISLSSLTSLFTKEPRKTLLHIALPLGVSTALIATAFAMFELLDFHTYPSRAYYTRWIQLVRGQLSPSNYNQQFDYLMTDNYAAAKIIRSSNDDTLFIWGTNPMLYALSDKMPTGRFTVSFHIKDFNAYEETYIDLVEDAPNYIVVMNNENGAFPQLYSYLQDNYIPNSQFQNFVVWMKVQN